MSEKNSLPGQNVAEYPDSTLERMLIGEYLLSKGYQLSDIQNLPAQELKDLMKEACSYAALKLAEIEARSKFRRKIEAR